MSDMVNFLRRPDNYVPPRMRSGRWPTVGPQRRGAKFNVYDRRVVASLGKRGDNQPPR